MQAASRRNWYPSIVTVLIVIACIVAIGWLQVPQLQRLKMGSQAASTTEIRNAVEVEQARLSLLKKIPSFGFHNLIADWTFLSFLQYFGDDIAREKTDYRLSPEYFDVILDRDPYFIQAYTFLSTSGSLYAGMPERSTALMKRGLQMLQPDAPPGSYFAWRQLAIDQLLFLGDAEAARRSFVMAASWASRQGDHEIAQASEQMANFLAKNPNSKIAQVAAWTMVLSNAPDKRTRQTAIDRIQALGGKVFSNADGHYQIQLPTSD